MSTKTIGAFLCEKVANMSKWLQSEGIEATHLLATVHDVQAVALAQILHEHYSEAIKTRSFAALCMETSNGDKVPCNVLRVVQEVQEAPALHDKFWRYLTLFSDTVSRTDE